MLRGESSDNDGRGKILHDESRVCNMSLELNRVKESIPPLLRKEQEDEKKTRQKGVKIKRQENERL